MTKDEKHEHIQGGKRHTAARPPEGAEPTPPETIASDGKPATDASSAASETLVAEYQAKIAALEDQVLRARADFQNLQRRTAQEKADAIRYANADLLRSLLNVIDDLDRTLAAVNQGENATAVGAGVRLSCENIAKFLRDQGVHPIEAANQAFDPALHNALMRQPSADHPAGTVVQQLTKGYKLRDRVLRPAAVVVSVGAAEAASADAQAQTSPV